MTVTSDVSQGFVLSSILFIAYSVVVINIVELHSLRAHGIADNLQVYGPVVQEDASSFGGSDGCLHQTCQKLRWPWISFAQPSKTELIWLSSSRCLHPCPADKVRISDADIQPSESVKDLGVLIDNEMTLTTHVNHLVGVCFFYLQQIRIIRRSLTTDTARLVALIHVHVNYCNSLLASCLKYLTDKLQSVRRAAARTSTVASVIRYWPHAPTVTLAWHSQSGEVQDRLSPSRCQYHLLAPHCIQPGFSSVF